MGEAAKSYWLDRFIEESLRKGVDEEVLYFTALPNGESEDDWKYGSD
ncbi:MAG: hypothetical protein RQ754_06975 [Desulfuromonadales bacterium]|nr:hypothetical protein [Desulfuromonadales bacterium]